MATKIRKIGNLSVNVVTDISSERNNIISKNDMEMDSRANAAVRSAIEKAKVCKKPIAKYDVINKKAYLEYANGEIKYVD